MFTGRDVLVVDGVALFVFGQPFVGVNIGESGTETIAPSCQDCHVASIDGVAGKIGVVEVKLRVEG